MRRTGLDFALRVYPLPRTRHAASGNPCKPPELLRFKDFAVLRLSPAIVDPRCRYLARVCEGLRAV